MRVLFNGSTGGATKHWYDMSVGLTYWSLCAIWIGWKPIGDPVISRIRKPS